MIEDMLPRPVAEAVDLIREKDLLLYASGVAFRVLIAAIPVTLFVVALLGFLGLEELWVDEAAPALRENVSEAVYTVIDDAVRRVLGGENGYWLTVGAIVALISLASVAKAVARTLNRIHSVDDDRSFADRTTNALGIGLAAGTVVLAALAVVRLGPYAFDAVLGDGAVVDVLSFLVRWTLAGGLLVGLLVLMKRVAPDLERPLHRLAAGSAITVAGWLAMSILFGLYLDYIAAYNSVFGNLATAYIAIQYVALSAAIYVAGLVYDALATEGGQ